MRYLKMLFIIIVVIFQIVTLLHAEEGMFPLSEIQKLNLKAAGMELQTDEIFNPNGVSLIDGIIMVGGCTGSFVSLDGLILTNHHCAYRAVQAASNSEHDYLQNGFLARDWREEIPAKGYTVRITESYADVSDEVLSVVQEGMTNSERTNAIEKKIKEIVKRAEEENPGKRAEVSEMFIGKSYYLFIYTWLKDVRLVYAPPRSIGEFGGETDNWIWPRHTGDFSFMRAYVAPDGSPAEYSDKNVPYHPRKFLKVDPQGVDEEDFVFILGYPGRTYRHRTSYFLAYEQEVRMPYVEQLYDWEISVMEKMGQGNRDVALKHSNRIKRLANVMKNYRGKLKGMKRLDLVEKKQMEEAELKKFIEADALRKEKYDSLFKNIGKIYAEIRRNAPHDLVLDYLRRSVLMFNFAYRVCEASVERVKNDLEREPAYMDRNFQRTKERVFLALKDYYEETDKIILKEMLMRAVELPAGQKIAALDELVAGKKPEDAVDGFIENAYSKTKMDDKMV
ncbi:MAG: S46 family peptidase, partial [Calditrichia bacterium]